VDVLPVGDNQLDRLQGLLLNSNPYVIDRLKQFESDMKCFGNPNNEKHELKLWMDTENAVFNIDEKDVFNVGFAYGLVGHGNYDYDLLWIAREILLHKMKNQPKDTILEKYLFWVTKYRISIDLYFVYLIKIHKEKKKEAIKLLTQDKKAEDHLNIINEYVYKNSWMQFTRFEHDTLRGTNKSSYLFNFMTRKVDRDTKNTNLDINTLVGITLNNLQQKTNTFEISESVMSANSKISLNQAIKKEKSLPALMANILTNQKNCSALENMIQKELIARKGQPKQAKLPISR